MATVFWWSDPIGCRNVPGRIDGHCGRLRRPPVGGPTVRGAWDSQQTLGRRTATRGTQPTVTGRRHRSEATTERGHTAVFYESRRRAFDAVATFFRRGIAAGERCVYLYGERTEPEVSDALADRGIDVAVTRETGDLAFRPAADVYLDGGRFDPHAAVERIRREVIAPADPDSERSGVSGGHGPRVVGEMSWAFKRDIALDRLATYERLADDVLPDVSASGLCLYDLDRTPESFVERVLASHPDVSIDGEARANPLYRGRVGADRSAPASTDPSESAAATIDGTGSGEPGVDGLAGAARDGPSTGSRPAGRDRPTVEGLPAGGDGPTAVEPDDRTEDRSIAPVEDSPSPGNSDPTSLATGSSTSTPGTGDTPPSAEDVHQASVDLAAAAGIDRRLESVGGDAAVLSALRERERHLGALRRSARHFQAGDRDDVLAHAVTTVRRNCEFDLVSVWTYADGTGDLRPTVTRTTLDGDGERAVVDAAGEHAWDAFAEHETREFAVEHPTTAAGAVVPLGRHGVFVAAAEGGELRSCDADFLGAVCGHAEAGLDRAATERALAEKNDQLSAANERLRRVDRINAVFRAVSRSLVDAGGREELTAAVCDTLVSEGPLAFAWFGSYGGRTETLEPAYVAGDERDYLAALSLVDGWTEREPAGRCARTRQTQVVEEVSDEPPLADWQREALRRGVRSVLAVPVAYDDSLYGVLSLYSDVPGVFDGELRTVVGELCDVFAHGINGLERRQALVCDDVTEIELAIEGADLPFADSRGEADYRGDVESVVPAADDGFRVFTTVHDAGPEGVRTFATACPTVTDVEVLSTGSESLTCAFRVTDGSFLATLLSHNAVPQSVRVRDGSARVVVQLSADRDVREFVETVREKYPSATLEARRDRRRSRAGDPLAESTVERELSDRQLEVLRTAYHGGYFERPRDRTAAEIAESLDVSHSTVSRHLRAGQQRLFSALFDEE